MKIKFSNVENLLELLKGDANITIEDLKSIEPIGIALLKLYAVTHHPCEITISGYGVFELVDLLHGKIDKELDYTPLVQFDNKTTILEEIVSDVTAKIISYTSNLTIDERRDLSRYLEYLISEMMDNVTSHSRSVHGGFISARYYPKSNKVQVVIIDSGVGLKESLSTYFTLENEAEAIAKAREKEVTGSNAFAPYTNVPKHAGLGLFFLSRILDYTGGRFLILSNNTIYRSEEDTYQELDTDFKGTMIVFELYEGNLDYNFSELFNIIKDEGTDYSGEEDVF